MTQRPSTTMASAATAGLGTIRPTRLTQVPSGRQPRPAAEEATDEVDVDSDAAIAAAMRRELVMDQHHHHHVVVGEVEEAEVGLSCPVCTFLNAAGMRVCEMCDTPLG